jgi:hypothetical protein
LPKQGEEEHNALADARWVRRAHLFLLGLNQPGARIYE